VLGSFTLPADTRRVWWLTEPSRSEPHAAFPDHWQRRDLLKAGNLELTLFTICPMGSEESARVDSRCPT
jgi:hypothetical protein